MIAPPVIAPPVIAPPVIAPPVIAPVGLANLHTSGLRGGLRIDGLTVRHDGHTVLSDISLRIRAGENLCLVGASGGGKSLIAASIAGLLPDCMTASGRIAFGGDIREASDRRGLRALWHHSCCLLPQEPGSALAPLLRGADQVALAPPRLSRADAVGWLAGFGLDRAASRRLPSAMSGGMAQRLLAAIVARTPAPVLVVDEPTKGLDRARRADLVGVLAALRDAGRALLVVTHDLEVVRALGGELAVLEAGRIGEAGPAARLLEQPRSAFLRACIAADPQLWDRQLGAPRRRTTGAPAVAAPVGAAPAVAGGENLVITRGRKMLVAPLQIGLREGRVTALLGPSGIGKTTLGDTLLGLTPPASGRVTWFGQTLDARRRRHLRARFQKLHQDPTAVFPGDLSFGASLSHLRFLPGGAEAAARLAPLLEQLHVSPALLGRRPFEVSGGEAQRLALARLLALRPAMLVADEPCSRLDPPVQADTMRLLRSLADEQGLSVLLIAHDAALAERVADDILTLEPAGQGRMSGWSMCEAPGKALGQDALGQDELAS